MTFHKPELAKLFREGDYRAENLSRLEAVLDDHYTLNRTLAQITPDWKSAELYCLKRQEYAPNPHAPPQWTQANLLTALHGMRATIARHKGADRQATI